MLIITDTYAKKTAIERCCAIGGQAVDVVSCDGALERYDSRTKKYALLPGKRAMLDRVNAYIDTHCPDRVLVATGSPRLDLSLARRFKLDIGSACVADICAMTPAGVAGAIANPVHIDRRAITIAESDAEKTRIVSDIVATHCPELAEFISTTGTTASCTSWSSAPVVVAMRVLWGGKKQGGEGGEGEQGEGQSLADLVARASEEHGWRDPGDIVCELEAMYIDGLVSDPRKPRITVLPVPADKALLSESRQAIYDILAQSPATSITTTHRVMETARRIVRDFDMVAHDDIVLAWTVARTMVGIGLVDAHRAVATKKGIEVLNRAIMGGLVYDDLVSSTQVSRNHVISLVDHEHGDVSYVGDNNKVYKEYTRDGRVYIQKFDQIAYDASTLANIVRGSYFVGVHKNHPCFVRSCPSGRSGEFLLTWKDRRVPFQHRGAANRVVSSALRFVF